MSCLSPGSNNTTDNGVCFSPSSSPSSSLLDLNLNLASTAIIIQSALTNLSTIIQCLNNNSNSSNNLLHLLLHTHIQILNFLIVNTPNNNNYNNSNNNNTNPISILKFNSPQSPKYTIRLI